MNSNKTELVLDKGDYTLDIQGFEIMKWNAYEELQFACSSYLELSKNALKSGKYVDLVKKIQNYFVNPQTEKYPLVIKRFMAYCFLVALEKMLPTYKSVDFQKLVTIALQGQDEFKKVKADAEFNVFVNVLIGFMRSIVDAGFFGVKEEIHIDLDSILHVYLYTFDMLPDDGYKLATCTPEFNYGEMRYTRLRKVNFNIDLVPDIFNAFRSQVEMYTFFTKLSKELAGMQGSRYLGLYHALIESKAFQNFLDRYKKKLSIYSALTIMGITCIDLKLLKYIHENMPAEGNVCMLAFPAKHVKDKNSWFNYVLTQVYAILPFHPASLQSLMPALDFLFNEGVKLSVLKWERLYLDFFLALAIVANNQKIITRYIPLWINFKEKSSKQTLAYAFQQNPGMLNFVIKTFKNTEGIDKLLGDCLDCYIDNMEHDSVNMEARKQVISILFTYPKIEALLEAYPAGKLSTNFLCIQYKTQKEAEKMDLMWKSWKFFKPVLGEDLAKELVRVSGEYIDQEMKEGLRKFSIS